MTRNAGPQNLLGCVEVQKKTHRLRFQYVSEWLPRLTASFCTGLLCTTRQVQVRRFWVADWDTQHFIRLARGAAYDSQSGSQGSVPGIQAFNVSVSHVRLAHVSFTNVSFLIAGLSGADPHASCAHCCAMNPNMSVFVAGLLSPHDSREGIWARASWFGFVSIFVSILQPSLALLRGYAGRFLSISR